MNYGSKLAFTGPGLVVGSVVINQTWLLTSGAALLIVGIACVRLGWRRGKQVETP